MHAVRLIRGKREAQAVALQTKARPRMNMRLIRQLREAQSMRAATCTNAESHKNTRREAHEASMPGNTWPESEQHVRLIRTRREAQRWAKACGASLMTCTPKPSM